MTAGRTRIAPTPSGFLHVGNLLNFELTRQVARRLNLDIVLRVDDVDSIRTRTEYLEDIQRALDWMGLSEIERAPSQIGRHEYYWDQLLQIQIQGAPLFACRCSRPQRVGGLCVAGCNELPATAVRDQQGAAIRCRLNPGEQSLWVNGEPTYQLVNVVEDRDLKMTHVVRGQDLEPTSVFHAALNEFLPGATPIRYAHHLLLLSDEGQKLSKSSGTGRLSLNDDLRQRLEYLVAQNLEAVLNQLSD